MDVLYWLALTLTSDESKAEQCFVAGLEECMGGNSVFKEWARSWAKRVVIKNAIRLMSPRPDMAFPPPIIRQQEKPGTRAEVALAALAHLGLFERFVYVMSVLEGYSDRDCASLLRCLSTDVAEARLRGLQQVRQRSEPSSAWLEEHVSEVQEVVADVA
jgi:DNA-directed RNA polymerase specialized sigma24 family protein